MYFSVLMLNVVAKALLCDCNFLFISCLHLPTELKNVKKKIIFYFELERKYTVTTLNKLKYVILSLLHILNIYLLVKHGCETSIG